MDREHMESLMALWDSETEDPETQEWRDSLTSEEARLVESWDRSWNSGVLKLSEDIRAADQRSRERKAQPRRQRDWETQR